MKYLALLSFAFALVFSSCNKYSEGPNFSLLTKKARVVNDWTLDSYTKDGTELYDVIGEIEPRGDLVLVITRKNGEKIDLPVTCRLDTADEVLVYNAGGVLQRFAQDFLAQ